MSLTITQITRDQISIFKSQFCLPNSPNSKVQPD